MNTLNKTLLGGSIAALIVGPVAAFAAPSIGDQLGTSVEDVTSALAAAGYTIQEVELDDDELEAVVLVDGQLLELEISSQTGEVTSVEVEDEDEDEDDEDDDDDYEDDEDDEDEDEDTAN